jgi:hypothetical protein
MEECKYAAKVEQKEALQRSFINHFEVKNIFHKTIIGAGQVDFAG